MTDLQVILQDRDNMIQELTESLKQSISIRDRLHEQSERLTLEVKQLRAATISDRNERVTDNQVISETTTELIKGSDEKNRKPAATLESSASVVPPLELSLPQHSIEEFKKSLTSNEVKLFESMQDKFNVFLHQELKSITKNYEQEVQEKNNKDAEINRLRQLLSQLKSGSVEVKELRTELDSIHKKEMEDLRMYFEQKCTDLEKQ